MSTSEIVSEHHFLLTSETSRFVLEASSLRPYLLTEGVWAVKPLYLSGGLVTTVPGLRITSPFVVSENGERLILAAATRTRVVDSGNAHIFSWNPTKVTIKTDRLIFDVERLDGEPWDNAPSPTADVVLAVALLQLRR